MSWLDYTVLAVIALWLGFSLRWIRRRKKQGKCLSCSGDCEHCTQSCRSRFSVSKKSFRPAEPRFLNFKKFKNLFD